MVLGATMDTGSFEETVVFLSYFKDLSVAAGIRLKLAASAFPSAPIGEQVLVRGDGEEVSLTSERRRR